jgi:hypothetical protein
MGFLTDPPASCQKQMERSMPAAALFLIAFLRINFIPPRPF